MNCLYNDKICKTKVLPMTVRTLPQKPREDIALDMVVPNVGSEV